MPPDGEVGIEIDRLIMLFTGQNNIKEVIAFPHLKSIEVQKNKLFSFSTTIRNPERYTEFLKVTKKFHNLIYSRSLLINIERELIRHGIYKPENMSQETRKKLAEGKVLSESEIDEILKD